MCYMLSTEKQDATWVILLYQDRRTEVDYRERTLLIPRVLSTVEGSDFTVV